MKKMLTKKASSFFAKNSKCWYKKQPMSPVQKNLIKYNILPSDNLQKKIDYFFTPYNRKLAFNKHMSFENEAEREWTDLTNFILKEDKATFR